MIAQRFNGSRSGHIGRQGSHRIIERTTESGALAIAFCAAFQPAKQSFKGRV